MATRGYALPNYYALDAPRIAIGGNFAALFQWRQLCISQIGVFP
jgi:hypothetical protein